MSLLLKYDDFFCVYDKYSGKGKGTNKCRKIAKMNVFEYLILYSALWLTNSKKCKLILLHYSFCGSMSFCYHLLWAFLSGRDESIAWVWESIFRLLYDQKWENVPISFWVLLLLGKFVFLFCTYFNVRNVHGHVYLLN